MTDWVGLFEELVPVPVSANIVDGGALWYVQCLVLLIDNGLIAEEDDIRVPLFAGGSEGRFVGNIGCRGGMLVEFFSHGFSRMG